MSIIYIVKTSGGRYDETWSHVVHAWTNMLDADAHVARLEAQATLDREVEASIAEFRLKYQATNPAPVFPSPPASRNYPRWPSGIKQQDITVEMRAERNAILSENQILSEQYHNGPYAEYTAATTKYGDQLEQALRQSLIDSGIPERAVTRYHSRFRAQDKYTCHEVETLELD